MSYLRAHLRVTSSMIIRELATRFGRRPGGYLWAILEPVAVIAMMSALSQVIARTPALGSSFPLYYSTGYMGFHFFRSTETFVNKALKSNKALFAYPTVARIDAVMARFILQMATATVVGFVVFEGVNATLRVSPTISWYFLITGIFWAGILALGTGMVHAVLVSRYAVYDKVMGIYMRPLMLISGVLLIPERLSFHAGQLMSYNPVCQVTMLFRKAFYPEYRTAFLDAGYLAAVSSIVLLVGLTMFTLNRNQFRSRD